MERLNTLDWIAIILLVIGGLNWGILGVFGFNVVAGIFGSLIVATRIIYILVGLAAIYLAVVSADFCRQKREK